MLLYTPLPLELVLAREADVPAYQEVVQGGVVLLVVPTPAGTRRIIQVWSTDPAAYLRPEYQPGKELLP